MTRAHDAAAAAQLREEEGEVIDLTARGRNSSSALPPAPAHPPAEPAPLARALSSPLVGARTPPTGLTYDALMLKHGLVALFVIAIFGRKKHPPSQGSNRIHRLSCETNAVGRDGSAVTVTLASVGCRCGCGAHAPTHPEHGGRLQSVWARLCETGLAARTERMRPRKATHEELQVRVRPPRWQGMAMARG